MIIGMRIFNQDVQYLPVHSIPQPTLQGEGVVAIESCVVTKPRALPIVTPTDKRWGNLDSRADGAGIAQLHNESKTTT